MNQKHAEAESEADLFERYFQGDLDAVERREFDDRLAKSAEVAARFAEAYDARTEKLGLRALSAPRVELSECFSPRTLERYVARELGPAERALVSEHASCTWCGQQMRALEELRALEKQPASLFQRAIAWLGLNRRSFFVLAGAAAAAAIVVLLLPPPASMTRSGSADGVSIEVGGGRIELSASEDRFVGVWIEGRWIRPEMPAGGIPPNLVELKAGSKLHVEIPAGKNEAEVTVVISVLPQNTAVVRGVLPETFEPGEQHLPIDGRPKLIRLKVARGGP